jgi:hypothetical protein
MKVIDNFLPERLWKTIHNDMLDDSFPWYYHGSSSSYNEEYEQFNNLVVTDKTDDNPIFIHMFYDIDRPNNSNWWGLVNNIVTMAEHYIGRSADEIYRVKANLSLPMKPDADTYSFPHYDSPKDHVTILYYVNDSDGDTVFFDDDNNIKDRISPKANRAVIFDSNILHAASNGQTSERRVVINTVLYMKGEGN